MLRYVVLLNPVVYISEGLRGVLTPGVPHMSTAVFLNAMVLLLLGLAAAGFRFFCGG